MEIVFGEGKIVLTNKQINKLDEFVFKVAGIIEKHTKYVIVSGYIPILFGRSRGTEDVDFIISPIPRDKFKALYDDFLKNSFEFINADDPVELFEMLNEKMAIRVSLRGTIFPNAEIKAPKDRFHRAALENRVEVILDDQKLFISPVELQIAYKLHLGGEKDVEDALFLEELFREYIDYERLQYWKRELGVMNFEF